MRHPKTDTDIVVGERVKSVSWQSKLLFFDQRAGSEARAITSLQQRPSLSLGRLGAVGSAASLALAIVLAGVFATALALAIVLAFARVLGGVGGSVLSDQEHAGVGGRTCSGGAALLDGLCVQARSRAAEQACKCGSNGEGMWSMVLHEGLPFVVGPRTLCAGRFSIGVSWCRSEDVYPPYPQGDWSSSGSTANPVRA